MPPNTSHLYSITLITKQQKCKERQEKENWQATCFHPQSLPQAPHTLLSKVKPILHSGTCSLLPEAARSLRGGERRLSYPSGGTHLSLLGPGVQMWVRCRQ